MRAIEKAAEAIRAAMNKTGFTPYGDYARAAILAFLDGVDVEAIHARNWVATDNIRDVLSALRAEAGETE